MIVLKAYDDLGNMVGAASCTDDADLERAKQAALEMANGLVHVNFEVIRNPEEQDVADIKGMLKAQGEHVAYVKAEEAYAEICSLYDNREITVTEAINRINALYTDEETRASKIATLLDVNSRTTYDDCDCDCDDECDCDDCDECTDEDCYEE